jgi:DNA-binding NarL/FixJ family response regulator
VKKLRILLADDHIVMRTGLRALLERQPNLEVVGESETDVKLSNWPSHSDRMLWLWTLACRF